MSVISEEDEKENNQLTLKLNQSLKESSKSSSSKNSGKEDELVVTSKCLIMKSDYIGKTASPPINHKKENQKIYDLEDDIFAHTKKKFIFLRNCAKN